MWIIFLCNHNNTQHVYHFVLVFSYIEKMCMNSGQPRKTIRNYFILIVLMFCILLDFVVWVYL